MNTVSVLGAGAWGTAIAQLLAENGYHVKLWCHEPEVAASIKTTGINERYLSGFKLHKSIEPITDLKTAICATQFVFEAVPVLFLRSVVAQTVHCFSNDQIWIILSKGIEKNTLMLPSQIIDDVFGYETKKAVLAGPSFAQDLLQKQITAVTIAAVDCSIGQTIQKMLANHYFRPYVSLDMIGVQVGASIKNVITLGIGMLDGAGYKDNAKAFLLTRGLHEMVSLAVVLGGKPETLYGLSGVGDLVMTATGNLSKNLALGKRIGAGARLADLQAELGTLPEGINTAQSVHELMQKFNLDLPVCKGIYDCVFENKQVSDLFTVLLTRPLEEECLIK